MDPSKMGKEGKFQQRRFSLPAGLKLSSACESLLQIAASPRRLNEASRAPPASMDRALVIASCMSEAEDFQRHLPHVKYRDVQFIYPPDITSDVMPYDRLLSACKEIMDDEEVDMLVCIHPHLVFVYASLLTQYPDLKGPSFESVFLCSHRCYCRMYVTNGFNNNYSMVEMDSFTSSQIASILGDLSSPALFTEAFNCTNRPVSMLVHTAKALRKELEELKTKVTDNLKSLTPLMVDKIDDGRYDLAREAVCLFEETKPHFGTNKMDNSDTGLYVVECCVSDGEVIPWIISDINYWTDRPHCKKSVTVPTSMGVATQFEVWAIIRELLEKLIAFGLKNSFVNITVQINTDGSVSIHDIYPGFVHDNVPLNRFVYQNGDTLRAHCDVSLGQEPHHIKMRPRHLAMKAYITLFASGSLNDLVDLKQLKSHKHVTLSVPDDVRIQILENRPESGLLTPDTSRSARSSFSIPDNDLSRLTTPDTGRSRLTTPETTRSRLATPDTSRPGESTPNGNRSRSKSETSATLGSISRFYTAERNKPELSPTDTYNSNHVIPDDITSSSSVTPVPSLNQPTDLTTEKIMSRENSPIPVILVAPDTQDGNVDGGHAVGMEGEHDMQPVIIADKDTGVCIGQMYVYGSTAEDCTKQLVDFLQTSVKTKEQCPWLT